MGLWIGITIFIIADLLVVGIVIWFLNKKFIGGYMRPYPPVEPTAEAHTERFQTVSIGLGNFGKSMHISVDESYLHLMPAKYLRWFGIAAMSVPWDDITDIKVDRRDYRATARLMRGNVALRVPAWCLAPVRD